MTAAEKLRMEIAQEAPFSKDEFISKISRLIKEQIAIDFARYEGFLVSYKHNSYGVRYIVFTL